MRKIIAILVLASALPLAACARTDFRAQYESKCVSEWKDSGYKTRLVHSRTGGRVAHTDYYDCQVLINGRWIPSDNVRVSL